MKLRRPAFVVRQGSVAVKAYRYGFTDRYALAYYRFPGDKLQRRTKTGEAAARALARQIALDLANGRAQNLELTGADREAYLYARGLLGGTSLTAAIEEWAYARKRLPPEVSLAEAVDDFTAASRRQIYRYPDPPKPFVRASKRQTLPATSGIYFVWVGEKCVYVGHSRNLAARCVIGKDHHAILSEDEMLSWIEQPPFRLSVAEAHYIGSLRPERNYAEESRAF